ncbi:MAG: methionine--tRNA ligase, partial [Thermoplasmata archaeon]|nr:methionine--tRNA ligase [Thermoplasmata archaeon]
FRQIQGGKMSREKIFIGVAWPYANGSLHLGHIAGCYLPADIFARFNRMIGNQVLMVSGSDEHGTPITITAEKEKVTPQEIVDRYHREHTQNMQQLGISFDLFTRTTTKNHSNVVKDVFLTLYKKGYIYSKEIESFYCEKCNRFLPDRYIEGTCPYCGNTNARGDQCDECGKLINVKDLKNVRCKICGSTPVLKKTAHLFFALSRFENRLKKWISKKTFWRPNVLRFTRNWLEGGLIDRAITRDINWGVEVPIKGFEEKRIYVWFDAVIGYLSASIEWTQKTGGKWEEWWKDKNAKHYYFLAKDNIPFHTIIWPSILMGYDETLNLPYDIPANEYLRLEGKQFSKSRGLAIWAPDVLKKFDADAIRYYLSINMPENKDTSWMWEDFIAKNNDELVGIYGNFVHRVLTFTYKNFGKIPEKPKQIDQLDKELLEKIKKTYKEVYSNLSKCSFKKALREIMNLAKFGNIYFDKRKPWELVKSDMEKCSATMYMCLVLVKSLAVLMAPFLPFSSNKIWKMLGYEKQIFDYSFDEALEEKLNIKFEIPKPAPLFKKIEKDEVLKMEEDVFSKLDLRAAKIIDVKDHPQADKLYLLQVDVGSLGKRILVAGMKPYYKPDELKGKNIVIVANLKPAKIRGIESKGMLLAAEDENGVVSILNPGDVKPGSDVYIEDLKKSPAKVLEFDEFKKIEMKVDEKQKIVYNSKFLLCENNLVTTDKPVKPGAKVL